MVTKLLFEGQQNIKKVCVKMVLKNLSSKQKPSRKGIISDLATSLWNGMFQQILLEHKTSIFMKICSAVLQLFLAYKRTDRANLIGVPLGFKCTQKWL